MKTKISLIILAAIGISLVACNKVSYKKTKGGMPYKIYSSGDTTRVDTNNFIKLHYTQKLNDSTMVTTFGKLPIYFQVTGVQQPYDLSELFFDLKKGDSVIAVQLVDTFMKRTPGGMPPNFKKGDKINTIVKILEVFRSQEAAMADEAITKQTLLDAEIKEVSDYLAKKNITATRTKSGAFVEIVQKGNGPKIDSGNYVMVKYKGTSFSGVVFDSNMDSSFGRYGAVGFIPGSGNKPGGSILGFDEGLLQLSGGDKARFYLPSLLGYGANSGTPDIKPFEHLIFDIEIGSVSPAPPAAMMKPPSYHPIDTLATPPK